MFRKILFALAAVATLGAGVVASTDASARGHGFHGGGHRGGFHGGGFHRGFHGGGFHRGFHRGGFHRGWHGGGWHRPRHFYGPRRFYGGPRFFGGPRFYGGYRGCYVRRLVPTPWGFRYRLINRCY